MKIKTVNIISFYELDPEWQAEAISNHDEHAKEAMYFEPAEEHNPTDHILWDLFEAMAQSGEHKGFKYNAVMGISNNSGMLININDNGDTAEYIFV